MRRGERGIGRLEAESREGLPPPGGLEGAPAVPREDGEDRRDPSGRGKECPETPSAKKLTDIGIRRIFSSEHDIFWESVRKFFQEELIPRHADWAGPGFSLHSDIVMPCIANHVSEEQMKHVPLVMAGRCTGAVAVREPRLEVTVICKE